MAESARSANQTGLSIKELLLRWFDCFLENRREDLRIMEKDGEEHIWYRIHTRKQTFTEMSHS